MSLKFCKLNLCLGILISDKLQGTAPAFNIRAVDCFCVNYYTCRLKILAATKCSANYNLDISSKKTSDFITYIFIARIDLNNLSQLFSHDSRHTSEQNKSNRFCLHRTDLHIVSFRWFAD